MIVQRLRQHKQNNLLHTMHKSIRSARKCLRRKIPDRRKYFTTMGFALEET